MRSLRARIGVVWALLAAVCAAMLLVLWLADRSGPQATLRKAHSAADVACVAIQESVTRFVGSTAKGDPTLLDVVTDLSLRDRLGVEGGVWDAERGFVAYGYPTYEGSSRKVDVPDAEKAAIGAIARQVSSEQPVVSTIRRGLRSAAVFSACLLPAGQVAWTLERVSVEQAVVLQRLGFAAAVGLGVLALVGSWLVIGLRGWVGRLASIETALSGRAGGGNRLEPTGERDLDRIVHAFNASAERIERLDADARRLGDDLAHAERLGALGRVAAGLAHEIRNPLGSMRLRAENALAVDGAAALDRRTGALRSVLDQIERLDGLVGSLLALTRPMRPQRRSTDLVAWLDGAVSLRQETAAAAGVALTLQAGSAPTAQIDEAAMGRALDNLILNAIQFTPPGSAVDVSLTHDADHWRVAVDDRGPGVRDDILPRLFEPFATARPGGTGLGLATAFEIVTGHHGRLVRLDRPDGATGSRFQMEVPWHAS